MSILFGSLSTIRDSSTQLFIKLLIQFTFFIIDENIKRWRKKI